MLATLASCSSGGMGSGMGTKPHRPLLDNTLLIAKREGMFRIGTVKGDSSAMDAVLNKDNMNCNSTTFAMPRDNTVQSFIREIYENELTTARKYSANGTAINVVVKTLIPNTSNMDKGTWTVVVDYTEDDKTKSVETITTFESKMSLLTACVNTANMFEEAVADNFVEYFKRMNK